MKLSSQPFALIGVNLVGHPPGDLKAVMEKEDLNWRSIDDDGTTGRKWNSPATPAFYVLDDQGVIRHKWIGHPGEPVIDAALETLIRKINESP